MNATAYEGIEPLLTSTIELAPRTQPQPSVRSRGPASDSSRGGALEAAGVAPAREIDPLERHTSQLLEALSPERHEQMLLVGAGSGDLAASASRLVSRVDILESDADLAAGIAARLAALACDNAAVISESDDWPPQGYDCIVVLGTVPSVSGALLDKLATGGRLILRVGGPGRERVQRWHRHACGAVTGQPLRFP